MYTYLSIFLLAFYYSTRFITLISIRQAKPPTQRTSPKPNSNQHDHQIPRKPQKIQHIMKNITSWCNSCTPYRASAWNPRVYARGSTSSTPWPWPYTPSPHTALPPSSPSPPPPRSLRSPPSSYSSYNHRPPHPPPPPPCTGSSRTSSSTPCAWPSAPPSAPSSEPCSTARAAWLAGIAASGAPAGSGTRQSRGASRGPSRRFSWVREGERERTERVWTRPWLSRALSC